MRLIDADVLIADLLTVDPQYETMIDWCCRVLEAQPTVDAVPVVRCKDCKHAIISAQMEHDDGSTTDYYLCELWHRPTEADGFCHRAEGRSDDD